MNIVQITPGAGGMFCGGCFRDNALVTALRKLGHEALMIPLYLPLTLDEADQSSGTPIFFSGINVYLEQKSALFRRSPNWLRKILASPSLLKLASGSAAKTRAADVGDLTVSMLQGEAGNQARELDELIEWLKVHQKPDVICLSNVLLVGMARRLKSELGVPVVCVLQGEDAFLDGLPKPLREEAWQIVSERAAELDALIAPSRYFGDLMSERLGLPSSRVHVVHNGINLDGYNPAEPSGAPVLGYFARMCTDKGVELVAEVFMRIAERGRVKDLRLHIGGGCGPTDEPIVQKIKERFQAKGLLERVAFFPNVDRDGKLAFFQKLTVFCTPALYGEAFGLYVIEALASGVPVVQPRHAAFPEIIEATGGGVIAEPNAKALAEAIEELLLNRDQARRLGAAGREAVLEKFTVERMANETLKVYESLLRNAPGLNYSSSMASQHHGAN